MREPPLGQTDAADVEALAEDHALLAAEDQLGRAAADVEDERPLAQGPVGRDPAIRQERFLVTGEEARREAVAPLDLAQERLAVLGVPDGARREREGALGAEPLGVAAIVDEHVPDARERGRQELAPRVDALGEARDREPAIDLLDDAVLDVRDEQPGGVGAEIDDADAHVSTIPPGSRAKRLADLMRFDAWYPGTSDAGWSSQVARRAHNPEVAGSNPAPAT